MSPHRRAVAWAGTCSAAVLVAGLFLPLWERVASVKRVEGGGGSLILMETVPIWRMLADSRPPPPYELDRTKEGNRNTSLVLVAVFCVVGPVVYLVRRPRSGPLEAVDFADGPDGAVVDGRA